MTNAWGQTNGFIFTKRMLTRIGLCISQIRGLGCLKIDSRSLLFRHCVGHATVDQLKITEEGTTKVDMPLV